MSKSACQVRLFVALYAGLDKHYIKIYNSPIVPTGLWRFHEPLDEAKSLKRANLGSSLGLGGPFRMLKYIVSATLAVATLLATASAEAQQKSYGPAPSPQHYRCTPDGKPATPGNGWCARDNTSPAKETPASSPTVVTGTPAGVRPLSPSELANLAQTISPQDLKQSAAAPQTPRATTPVVAQAPAQPNRVFTPGVNIEVLAGAFKETSESNVLNAPISEVEAAIAKFSGVDVSPELLVRGALVDCQKAGVEGKHRVGVKSKQRMNGLKQFNFAVVGSELKDCQPGQKLYIVQDRDGKNVAIADNSGFLLGKAPTVAEVKVDR